MFISCSCPLSHFQAWHPFHMGGFFIASESRLFPRVHSPPTGYSSGHLWRLVSISSSQCYRVILSDIPTSLKIVCLETYSLSSPSYSPSCVSLTLIITSSTLVSCRLQHIIRERNLETCYSCGTLETIFWWFSSRLLVVFTIDHYSVDFPHVRPQIHLFTWDEMYQVR
jgi:hypothetical protein